MTNQSSPSNRWYTFTKTTMVGQAKPINHHLEVKASTKEEAEAEAVAHLAKLGFTVVEVVNIEPIEDIYQPDQYEVAEYDQQSTAEIPEQPSIDTTANS